MGRARKTRALSSLEKLCGSSDAARCLSKLRKRRWLVVVLRIGDLQTNVPADLGRHLLILIASANRSRRAAHRLGPPGTRKG